MDNPVERAKEIEGWMYPEELEWLYEAAKRMDSVVEIGSYKGRSTYVLCSGCQGKVYAVDCHWCEALRPFVGSVQHTFPEFMENVGHFLNMVPLEMTSMDAAAPGITPPEVDMVFIDGDHVYESVLADLKLWDPRTRKLLCGHDLKAEYPGVEKALNEYFDGYKVARGPGSLWYVDK
jgi:hypothetical protein